MPEGKIRLNLILKVIKIFMSKFAFLGSTRFWALISLASVTGLAAIGIIPAELANPIVMALTGFIGIRTVDRFGEKSGSVDTR